MKLFNLKKEKGFTLVEMMVAISVFSIVMVTAMSALLSVIDANSKARAVKTVVNNISFALEGISRDMRVGTDYICGNTISDIKDITIGTNCNNGGSIIKYRSVRADTVGNKNKFAYYKFDSAKKQIFECLEKGGVICSDDSLFTEITSKDAIISKAVFYVLGANSSITQPRVLITVKGTAGTKAKIVTEFDLQTTVSQITR